MAFILYHVDNLYISIKCNIFEVFKLEYLHTLCYEFDIFVVNIVFCYPM